MRVSRFVHLAVLSDYYDAWQLPVAPFRARDFRSGAALGRIYFVDPLGEVALSGGYRGFEYKPDPYFDFQPAQATAYGVARLVFGANGEHELDVAATYHFERRFFNGVVAVLPEPRRRAVRLDAGAPLQCAYGMPIQDLLPRRRHRSARATGFTRRARAHLCRPAARRCRLRRCSSTCRTASASRSSATS